MQPRLEIRRIGPDFFTYSLRAGRTSERHGEDSLASLAHCLNDAGDCLGHYFPAVSVCLDGQELGSYEVERLLRSPASLAAELMDKARPGALQLS
jgi:hypothetical protein